MRLPYLRQHHLMHAVDEVHTLFHAQDVRVPLRDQVEGEGAWKGRMNLFNFNFAVLDILNNLLRVAKIH